MKTYEECGITIEPGPGRSTSLDKVSFYSAVLDSRVAIENDLKHQPNRIQACATTLGIKESGNSDFVLVRLPQPQAAAGVFTRNACPSCTVLRNRRVIQGGLVQGLAVNSGNANVCTPRGEQDLERIASLVSHELDVPAAHLIVSSTGVIGVPLPMEKFERGIPGLRAKLRDGNLEAAAQGILTTDLGPKTASVKIGDLQLAGICKGAGMIEPDMATMLVYLFTNARCDSQALQTCLVEAVNSSFNCMSVDSDTSTSDSVVLMTTGDVPLDDKLAADFTAALKAVCIKLTRDIVSQGEGATKIIEAAVDSDRGYEFSRQAAKRIINSPLVKTAVHGADPNWGRIVMAIGKPQAGAAHAPIGPDQLSITIQGHVVYDRGKPVSWDRPAVESALRESREIGLGVRIGGGGSMARAWGCDLSMEYVRINALYTT